MKNNVKVILFYVLLIAAIFVAVLAMMGNPSSNEEPIFSDIMQYFEEDRVKEFEVSSENVLTLIVYKTDKAGLLMPEDVANAKTEKINYKLRDIELFRAEFEKYQNNKNLEKYDYKPLASYVWMSLIPTILTTTINTTNATIIIFLFFIKISPYLFKIHLIIHFYL